MSDLTFHPALKNIADSLKELKMANIIRTKNLVGDLGEHYCEKIFNLKRQGVVNKGYDALDAENLKVEIKTRRNPTDNAKVIFKAPFDFDYCLFVELNEHFEPIKILKIQAKEIISNLDKVGDRLSVSKIKKTKHKIVF